MPEMVLVGTKDANGAARSTALNETSSPWPEFATLERRGIEFAWSRGNLIAGTKKNWATTELPESLRSAIFEP